MPATLREKDSVATKIAHKILGVPPQIQKQYKRRRKKSMMVSTLQADIPTSSPLTGNY